MSYTNNVIKIRKDNVVNVECSKHGHAPINYISYSDSVIKDVNLTKDNDKLQAPPIMTQKSFDFVVDSLTSDICRNEHNEDKRNETQIKDERENDGEYSVTVTLPNGQQITMKSADQTLKKVIKTNAKEKLKTTLANKAAQKVPVAHMNRVAQKVSVVQALPPGTFIPVTIINPPIPNKIPIVPFVPVLQRTEKKPVKRKKNVDVQKARDPLANGDDCVLVDAAKEKRKDGLDAKVAASRRYR